MKIEKAYKFRIYPTKKQEYLINKTIDYTIFVYNYFYKLKEELYWKEGKILSLKEMNIKLKKLKQQDEYSYLNEVDETALIAALTYLNRAYYLYFKKITKHPREKTKKIKNSYTSRDHNSIILNTTNKTITLSKIGPLKCRGYRSKKEFKSTIESATLIKEGGKYYLSLNVYENIEDTNNIKLKQGDLRVVGIDVGIKSLVVTSDGKEFPNIKSDRVEKRIEKLQQQLSLKEIDSNNFNKIKQKIDRCFLKIKNMRHFAINDITNYLINNYDVIVMESLYVREMVAKGNKSLKKNLLNAALGELERQLFYKAKWKGKKVIKINKYYPSSQLCSVCGYRNSKVKNLNIREWTCLKCNTTHQRDINASINILNKGLEELENFTLKN